MDSLLVSMVLVHVGTLCVAGWCFANRRRWLQLLAVLLLASDAITAWILLAGSGQHYAFGLAVMVLGPLAPLMLLFEAALRAPLWVLPLVIAGTAAGAGVWLLFSRRGKTRAGAVYGVLAGIAATWILAEVSVEIVLRTSAAIHIAGACDFSRSSTPTMFRAQFEDYGPAHATVQDGERNYNWSFRQNRFVERYDCKRSGQSVLTCSCPGKR